MKDIRKTEIKVGVIVVLGLLIFIWILGWAKNFSFDSNEKQTTVRFDNIAGLDVGDVVMVNGVRSGYVQKVNAKENYVLVDINLLPDTDLRDDAQFCIMMLDLMGGKKIEVNPGISSESLNLDEIHDGKFSGDISTAMAMLSSVQKDLVDVIKEIKITLTNMNEVITDENFSQDLKSSVANMAEISENVDALLKKNNAEITNLIKVSSDLVNTGNEILTSNKTQIDSALTGINIFLVQSNQLVEKLSGFADEVKTKNNNLGKLMYDDELMDNIKTSITQLKELTKLLIEQLKGEGINVDANIF